MPLLTAAQAPSFALPGVQFTGLAAPSRGSRETAVWMVEISPGTEATPHQVTREEIFVVLDGEARALVGAECHHLSEGTTLIVPPDTAFVLDNPYPRPFRAVVVFPVGGQAKVGENPPFTPPWAE